MEDIRIRKGIEGREFWQCCPRTCVIRVTTVNGERNIMANHAYAPKEKVQATGAEGSVDQRQNRMSDIDAIGHLIGL